MARRRNGQRVSVEARLLGATVGEGWAVMGDLLDGLHPKLILVDGEDELSALAAERRRQRWRRRRRPQIGHGGNGGAPRRVEEVQIKHRRRK